MKAGWALKFGVIGWLTAVMPPIYAQTSTPLEVQAIVRMAPEKPEQHQLFRGPAKTTKQWNLCVVLPNVSDNFWDEVASGVREESARLGATSVIYEARGYTEAGRTQQEKILTHRCGAGKMNAVLLAAVSRTGLNDAIQKLRAQNIVVIDFINGYDPQQVDGRSFLDNYHLGRTTGVEIKKYLATHFKNQTPNILWIPGPKGPDWAQRGDEGFTEAMAGATAKIETLYFTPHYREQRRDLREHLQSGKTYDLIVGSGSTSIAVYQLKAEGIIPQATPVFAYYATPDVLKLLAKKQIIGTVSNEPKMQGRMGVALAIGLLEKIPMPFQIGPEPVLLIP
jgi:ABC-type sugar transport system substrate-binding protein